MIVTIGGGSGMPIVNQALIKAGFNDINSIVTTFDSGGDSGRIRTDERGSVLAFSDYWRSLMSLWDDSDQKTYWQEMLKYRDGRGRNFGNMFFQFMAERSGDLSRVDSLFSQLTQANLCGQVIPVATQPTDICFITKSGRRYCGEHNFDDQRMSRDMVEKVWLSQEVEANPEALRAVEAAELIILCPGSLYGSILTNFLPVGMRQSMEKSRAKKILITNVMSVCNETDGFDQDKYVETINHYIKISFDKILMADFKKLDQKILKKVLDSYSCEHSVPIIDNSRCKNKATMVDIATIDEINLRLRHSVHKLADIFAKMDYVAEKN